MVCAEALHRVDHGHPGAGPDVEHGVGRPDLGERQHVTVPGTPEMSEEVEERFGRAETPVVVTVMALTVGLNRFLLVQGPVLEFFKSVYFWTESIACEEI